MADYELYHSGVKGMKWGVRRYQNKDGSLTPAGKKRYLKGGRDAANRIIQKTKNHIQTSVNQRKAKKVAEKAAEEEAKQKNRPVRSLSDSELREKINRLKLEREALDLERQISSLDPKTVSSGKAFITDFANKAITPAIMDAGKRVMTDFLTKKSKELMGLQDVDANPFKELEKSVKGLELQKKKHDLENYLDRAAKKKQEAEAKAKKKEEDSKVHEGTVVGEGNSKKTKSSDDKKGPYDDIIIDEETAILAIRKTEAHKKGKKFINEMFD